MSDDIFDTSGTPPVETPKPPVIPDHLKELIGEGKKYATVDKAIESLPHKEAHILRLEQENAQFKEKLSEAIAIEEVYKKLTESAPRETGVTPPSAGMDEASVASVVKRQLLELEQERMAEANVKKVKDALIGKYGDKAKEVYDAKAQEFGVSKDFLNDIVRKSPRAAEELFGIAPKVSNVSSTTGGSINTSALTNNRPPDSKPNPFSVQETDLVKKWRKSITE